jgi:hypothetical protein
LNSTHSLCLRRRSVSIESHRLESDYFVASKGDLRGRAEKAEIRTGLAPRGRAERDLLGQGHVQLQHLDFLCLLYQQFNFVSWNSD